MLTRTPAEKKAAFIFTKTFAKKRQADFENLQSHVSTGSTTDHEQSRSHEIKPIKTNVNRNAN